MPAPVAGIDVLRRPPIVDKAGRNGYGEGRLAPLSDGRRWTDIVRWTWKLWTDLETMNGLGNYELTRVTVLDSRGKK